MNYEQIQLYPFQLDSFNFMNERLDKQFSIMNVSPTGAGKTVTILAIAAYRQLIPFVVAPAGIEETWKDELTRYGFTTYHFMSYSKLGGKKEMINHPYLTKSGKVYYATDYLRQLIQYGILIILDESHLAKNAKSNNLHACHTLTRTVMETASRSRIVLMSATPYDKVHFSESMLKMLGIVYDEKMYIYDKVEQKYIYQGIKELIHTCKQVDKSQTDIILSKYSQMTNKTIPNICHLLFVNVIKPLYVSRIDPVFPTQILAYNGFYKVSPETQVKLSKIVGRIKDITGYNNGHVSGKIDYGELNIALHELERAKMEIAYRVIYSLLSSSPNTKVILYLRYHDTTEMMLTWLGQFRPLLLNGQIAPKKRAKVVKLFQEPNDKCRLIIGHPVAGGAGLSLDDRDGNWPRVMFIMPDYRLLETTQAMGRIRRVTSRSNGLVMFFYSIGQRVEANIMRSLMDKTAIVRDVIDESDIKITGELEPWVEQ